MPCPLIDRAGAEAPQGPSLLIVRFFSYFPALGIAALPVGVAAQITNHAGTPNTPITAEWVPNDSARPWRDMLDGALAAGAIHLGMLAEAWANTVGNGVTLDLSVQAMTLPPSVDVGPELTEAAVDLLYWQVLTEHVMLLAEAEGLGLTA